MPSDTQEVILEKLRDDFVSKLKQAHEEGNFDAVERPQHYTKGPMEVIDIIEQYGFCDDFRLGNCVKYLFRHKLKGNPLQDLKKARWYLDRLIKSMEKEG